MEPPKKIVVKVATERNYFHMKYCQYCIDISVVLTRYESYDMTHIYIIKNVIKERVTFFELEIHGRFKMK